MAELESVERLEERFPGYSFEVAQNPNKEYDVIGKGPEGMGDVFVQVKAGGLDYARDVVQRMDEAPEHIYFAKLIKNSTLRFWSCNQMQRIVY